MYLHLRNRWLKAYPSWAAGPCSHRVANSLRFYVSFAAVY